jgi:hypothetical protein
LSQAKRTRILPLVKKTSVAKPAPRKAAKPRTRSRGTGPKAKPKPQYADETEEFLKSLREHNQVIEADRPDVDLPPGVNYVLVHGADEEEPQLVERRKSFI